MKVDDFKVGDRFLSVQRNIVIQLARIAPDASNKPYYYIFSGDDSQENYSSFSNYQHNLKCATKIELQDYIDSGDIKKQMIPKPEYMKFLS